MEDPAIDYWLAEIERTRQESAQEDEEAARAELAGWPGWED